jgi:hypothetical protein
MPKDIICFDQSQSFCDGIKFDPSLGGSSCVTAFGDKNQTDSSNDRIHRSPRKMWDAQLTFEAMIRCLPPRPRSSSGLKAWDYGKSKSPSGASAQLREIESRLGTQGVEMSDFDSAGDGFRRFNEKQRWSRSMHFRRHLKYDLSFAWLFNCG